MGLWGVLLFFTVMACKKDQEHVQEQPDGIKVPHGMAIGEAISQTIGPNGGTIQLPDGRMRIDIPAGAVDTETNFSIQPVEQTLELGSGNVYRLGPENVDFQKDIIISFNYDDADVQGTAADFLYLAYQDKDGYWHLMSKTSLDKTHKTLTVETRHFSDWTVHRNFYMRIYPFKTEYTSAEEVYCNMLIYDKSNKPISDEEDLLYQPIEPRADQMAGWKLQGLGTITKESETAVNYKTPAQIAEPSKAIIEATLVNVVDKQDPSRPGNGGKVIVQCTFQLASDEFCKWTVGGEEFTAVNVGSLANAGSGQLQIVALSDWAASSSLSLLVRADKVGTYTAGDTNQPDKFGTQLIYQEEPYLHYYSENGKIHYRNGTLTLSRLDTKWADGHFSATCNTSDGRIRQVTGSFHVKLPQLNKLSQK